MRNYGDFDRYARANRKKYAEARGRVLVLNLKKDGCQPKDADEMKILRILASARMKRWQREGKFKIIGPREYALNIF